MKPERKGPEGWGAQEMGEGGGGCAKRAQDLRDPLMQAEG